MIVSVNRELYRYEIHSLVKAFYPAEDVDVRVAEDDAIPCKEGTSFCVTYHRSYMQIQDEHVTLRADAAQGAVYDEKNAACKQALKSLLYRFLQTTTGRSLPWGDLIGIRPTKIVSAKLEEGASAKEAARFLEEVHEVSHEKAQLASEIAVREQKILSSLHREDGYSLYIGIPFCPTTCLYCSFPSFHLSIYKERVDAYLDALEKEMQATSELMDGRILDTIYIGGGTPTSLDEKQLERLLCAVDRYFPRTSLQEFTVEAGRADTITEEKLRVIRSHGNIRISVNPQTMRDETLRMIGRNHTSHQAEEAFCLARKSGFDNINMDIILGLPGEHEEDVAYTVERISALGPDSLTVHSLAVKRASRLAGWIEQNGISLLRNSDECMRIAAKGAAGMGMVPYYLYRQKNMAGNFENVGYAKEDKFGIYNMLIIEEIQSIAALGAGAVSKHVYPGGRIERSDNVKEVSQYIERIDEMLLRKKKLFSI